MAFCKELFKPKAVAKMPQPLNWEPGEKEIAARAWWENSVSTDIENLQASTRRLKWIVFILALALTIGGVLKWTA